MTLIDGFVLLGVAVVLPLALGGSLVAWLGAAAAIALSFSLDTGAAAAVLVAPLIATLVVHAVTTVRRSGGPRFLDHVDLVRVLGCGWALVAAGSLVQSRLGWTLFGIDEPIVELTAMHYLYAGSAATVLAGWTNRRLPLVLTLAAPPIVAVGFIADAAVPQVGGAALMALGVWATAVHQLLAVSDRARPRGERALLAVSGLAIWVPMVLAVAWAAGQHWSVPVLSIPDMARTHGAVNAAGFVGCGLLARRRERREHDLVGLLERAITADLTYARVGVTLTDACNDTHTRLLGSGREVFDEAVRRLQSWAPQRHLGARVLPTDARPEVGTTILIDLRLGPIALAVPDRVVAVVDAPDRWGFAYGTLRGHHERGEESFVITHHPDDSVTATIAVEARAASIAARLAGPVVHLLQRLAIRRYLEALA